jgi:hypothetical protein
MSRFRKKYRMSPRRTPGSRHAGSRTSAFIAGKITIYFIVLYLLIKGGALLWHWLKDLP